MLGAVRRAVGEQHGGGGRHRVDDADDGLLRHVAPAGSRERQDQGSEECRPEPERVGLPRVQIPAEEERGGGAEGGDLGQGDVDEDDLARQHVHAEIGVDAREHETHQEREPQEREELAGHATATPPPAP